MMHQCYCPHCLKVRRKKRRPTLKDEEALAMAAGFAAGLLIPHLIKLFNEVNRD